MRSMPDLGRKLKLHLLLHLVDNIIEFGPCSSFSTERYLYMYMHSYSFIHFYPLEQAHEGRLCTSLIFSTDLSRSTHWSDLRMFTAIAVLPVETLHITSLCWNTYVQFVLVLSLTVLLQKGMCLDLWLMSTIFKLISLNLYFRCGQGLSDLYHSTQVQRFINCTPAKDLLSEKAIYQPGCLRNVKYFVI